MSPILTIILISLAKTIGLIFIIILPMVSYTVYAERRVSAMIQDRLGPNRVGIPMTLLGFKKDIPFFGLLQPIADAVKLLLKEYFELEDHPARTIPYTPREETAKTQRTPTFTLAITIGTPRNVLPNGMTAKAIIDGAIAHAGASQ